MPAVLNTINRQTNAQQDGASSMLNVRGLEDAESGGYVLAVKAIGSSTGVLVTNYRRSSRSAAKRHAEVNRLPRGRRR